MKRWILVLVLLALGGCDKAERRDMETRSYQLARLSSDEAISLLTPYIREGGYLSGKNDVITVREKADRLKLIEDLLKRFDGGGEAADLVMRMQVIEANGVTERDPAIADIEQTLRDMFKYRGYRLVGETQVRVREGSSFEQKIGEYGISGRTQRLMNARIPVELVLFGDGGRERLLASTVTATMGKPIVLGQSTSNGAIILVIRPALAGT